MHSAIFPQAIQVLHVPPQTSNFGPTNLRSVTWTKVSLNEAKMRATPKTSSLTFISNQMVFNSDQFLYLLRGSGVQERCSRWPGARLSSLGAFWLIVIVSVVWELRCDAMSLPFGAFHRNMCGRSASAEKSWRTR